MVKRLIDSCRFMFGLIKLIPGMMYLILLYFQDLITSLLNSLQLHDVVDGELKMELSPLI